MKRIIALLFLLSGCQSAPTCANVTADIVGMQSVGIYQAAFTVGGERVVIGGLDEAQAQALMNGATRNVCR